MFCFCSGCCTWLGISRSPLLWAINSHTDPMSRHFYRPVYFYASLSAKYVSSGLHEHSSVRNKMAASGRHVDLLFRWNGDVSSKLSKRKWSRHCTAQNEPKRFGHFSRCLSGSLRVRVGAEKFTWSHVTRCLSPLPPHFVFKKKARLISG